MSTWAEQTIDSLTETAEQRDLTTREQRKLDQAIATHGAQLAHEARVARWQAEA